ncbi:hypothetical protein EST62_05185 [Chlorobaculum sp. 24CR]|jgi:hypothetical protein|uniref:hypothetical protein n=1 Tax=Chlorobaculum sp. 24CR TaxID=2508878 RepID=UPI00100B7742|nr:hypothetical protein [Chlorobaculum sp. 24CR]RXK87907.1 hypothetical protein EST62_05185 [Chlorobaculum sp. 24CR]
MLKEAAAVTGGALLLPPIGVSMVACGLPGLLIAGAGFFLFDAVMQEKRSSAPSSGDAEHEPGNDWPSASPAEPGSFR